MNEYKTVKIGDALKRIKRPIVLENEKEYKLVTVKLYHKGVALRGHKKGCDIGSKMYEVKSGDFILSGIDARNGAFGIVGDELDGAIVTNDFWYFELNKKMLDKHFFLELTSTKWFDEICRLGSDGTTQRIRLQKDRFFNQDIYLPTIEKQKELSKKLILIKGEKQKLDEKNNEQDNYLASLRQQILQDAISGRLTADWRAKNPDIEPACKLLEKIKAEKEKLIAGKKIKKEKPLPKITENEIPFELPDNWEWCRFNNVAYIVRGGSPRPISSYITDDEDGLNWIKIGDTQGVSKYIEKTKQKIKKEGLRHSRFVEIGDFILSNSMSFGRPYIMKTTGCIHDGWLLIKEEKLLIDKDYLYNMLLSNYILKSFETSAQGGVVQNLNIDKVKSTLIPLPPLAEQEAIVTKLEKLMGYASELEEIIKQNKQDAEILMQSFLAEAFMN